MTDSLSSKINAEAKCNRYCADWPACRCGVASFTEDVRELAWRTYTLNANLEGVRDAARRAFLAGFEAGRHSPETFACPRKICGWTGVHVAYDQGVPVCPKCGGSFEQRSEAPQLKQALDYGDALADWINRARPVVTELMEAYARRIRSDCIDQADLESRPWRCAEYIAAEELLRDQPKAVVEIRRAVEKSARPCHRCDSADAETCSGGDYMTICRCKCHL